MSRCDFRFPDGRHCVLKGKHGGDHSNFAFASEVGTPDELERRSFRLPPGFAILAILVTVALCVLDYHVSRIATALEAAVPDPTHARD